MANAYAPSHEILGRERVIFNPFSATPTIKPAAHKVGLSFVNWQCSSNVTRYLAGTGWRRS